MSDYVLIPILAGLALLPLVLSLIAHIVRRQGDTWTGSAHAIIAIWILWVASITASFTFAVIGGQHYNDEGNWVFYWVLIVLLGVRSYNNMMSASFPPTRRGSNNAP